MVWFIPFLHWTSDLLEPESAGEFTPRPIDLSKATKLKDVVLRCGPMSNRWVTMTLETIPFQHQDLQRISIHFPHILVRDMPQDGLERIEGTNPRTQWPDLDRLLVRFWDSCSIRPKVVYPQTGDPGKETRDWVSYLLPEITERGVLVKGSSRYR